MEKILCMSRQQLLTITTAPHVEQSNKRCFRTNQMACSVAGGGSGVRGLFDKAVCTLQELVAVMYCVGFLQLLIISHATMYAIFCIGY